MSKHILLISTFLAAIFYHSNRLVYLSNGAKIMNSSLEIRKWELLCPLYIMFEKFAFSLKVVIDV